MIVYALQILTSLMMVSFVFVMIMIAEASTERINEVLDEVPEMEDKADAVTEVTNGDIEFEHVNFSYAGEGGNLSLKRCKPSYKERSDRRNHRRYGKR